MPGKTVRNRTGAELTVTLMLRPGAEPLPQSEPHQHVEETFQKDEEKFIAYGDDANPFIDDLWVNYNFPGLEGGGSRNYGSAGARGDQWDTAMNTNNTITVSLGEGHSILIDFTNG